MTNSPPLVIDACVLLNLLATDRFEDILVYLEREILVCSIVSDEVYYLKSYDKPGERGLIKIQPYIDIGILLNCHIEDSEVELLVNLSSQLDEGEAMSLAIAISREFDIATDDKKALRVFREAGGDEIKIHSTLSLIRDWAESRNISEVDLQHILKRIKEMANYIPRKTDSNYLWWDKMISD